LKNRQYNDQRKRTNNDLQSTTQKTKDEEQARQKRIIFPRFTLYDVEPDWRKKAVVLKGPVENTQRKYNLVRL
jgi:hypothetical protein